MKTINTQPIAFEPKTRNRFRCSVKDSTGLFLISDVIRAVECPSFSVANKNGDNIIIWKPIHMQVYDPIKPSATEAIWAHLNRNETFDILIELLDPVGTVTEQWHLLNASIIEMNNVNLDWSNSADPVILELHIRYEHAKLITVHDDCRLWIEKNIKLRKFTSNDRLHNLLKLNQYQQAYINKIDDPHLQPMLLCVDRQQGYTTATAAYCIYKLHHSKNQRILITSSNHDIARNMINLILELNSYSLNPLKLRAKSSNELHFNDGSIIRSISVSSDNVIDSKLRGCRIDYVFMQEYAYYPDLTKLLLTFKPMTNKIIGYSYPVVKSH